MERTSEELRPHIEMGKAKVEEEFCFSIDEWKKSLPDHKSNLSNFLGLFRVKLIVQHLKQYSEVNFWLTSARH